MNAAGNPHAAAALAHHNFFFPGNQREHFRSVFRQREIPHDPTIYLVAASRTDPTVAPPGCDGLKILPHIPPLDERRPVPHAAYVAAPESAGARRSGSLEFRLTGRQTAPPRTG